MDWYRATIGIAPTDGARNFVFGLLSEEEARTIRSGVTEMVGDHLVDAMDRGDRVELVLRSGATRQIEPDRGSSTAPATSSVSSGGTLPMSPMDRQAATSG